MSSGVFGQDKLTLCTLGGRASVNMEAEYYLYQYSTSPSKSSLHNDALAPSSAALPLALRTAFHISRAAACIALHMYLLPCASNTRDCQ